jgi:3',5'-cyclic AMP phosphodiesterase CpdA
MLIAHFSDTHIKPKGRLAYNKVDTASMLKAAVSHVQTLPQQPDLLLITGDLVDQGQPEEYAHLKEILAPLPYPMLLVPGNHDDRHAMRQAFPHLLVTPSTEHWQFCHQEATWPLRIIGLDTVDPGQSGGFLCADRLTWFASVLNADTHLPTLVMMHHPPFLTGIGHMDDIGLSGREAFADLVRQHDNIELIICGHLHRNIRSQVGGRAVMTAHSTAHTVQLDIAPDAPAMFSMEPPGYLLHWWNGTHLVTHHAHTGSFEGPYPFFEASGQLIT